MTNSPQESNHEKPPAKFLSSADWEGSYQQGKTGWDRGKPNPQLLRWLGDQLQPPKRILIPGCGYGHELLELSRRGFEVTGLDFAKQPVDYLLKIRESESLKFAVLQSDVFDFQPLQPFQAIYEQTCLCAISPDRWTDYEQKLFHWLTTGGVLFILFMQTGKADGPPYDCPVDSMRQLFARDRWDWKQPLESVDHPAGLTEIATVLTKVSPS